MNGFKAKIYCDEDQRTTILHWISGARFLYNQKVAEDRYLRTFARKYLPVNTYPEIDNKFSHFKSGHGEWLKEIPSQILRASVNKWYDSYQRFFKKLGGRPTFQKKSKGGDIVLDKDCFKFVRETNSHLYLFVGQKRNNVGIIKVKKAKDLKDLSKAKQIRISYRQRVLSLSLVTGEKDDYISYANESLAFVAQKTLKELYIETLGGDRGITTALETGEKSYDLDACRKLRIKNKERYIKRYQRQLARQTKGSKRREKTREKLQKAFSYISNVREDFSHKTSHALVKSDAKILALENLPMVRMTKSAKGTKKKPGKNVKAKSGLNRSILSKGWGSLASKIQYKCQKFFKVLVKINPAYTSQMCSSCGHIHPENRSGKNIRCLSCGFQYDADKNAATNIRMISVALIHLGQRLDAKGVLKMPKASSAREEFDKTMVQLRTLADSLKREPLTF